jgi:hypothetical protein
MRSTVLRLFASVVAWASQRSCATAVTEMGCNRLGESLPPTCLKHGMLGGESETAGAR